MLSALSAGALQCGEDGGRNFANTAGRKKEEEEGGHLVAFTRRSSSGEHGTDTFFCEVLGMGGEDREEGVDVYVCTCMCEVVGMTTGQMFNVALSLSLSSFPLETPRYMYVHCTCTCKKERGAGVSEGEEAKTRPRL